MPLGIFRFRTGWVNFFRSRKARCWPALSSFRVNSLISYAFSVKPSKISVWKMCLYMYICVALYLLVNKLLSYPFQLHGLWLISYKYHGVIQIDIINSPGGHCTTWYLPSAPPWQASVGHLYATPWDQHGRLCRHKHGILFHGFTIVVLGDIYANHIHKDGKLMSNKVIFTFPLIDQGRS